MLNDKNYVYGDQDVEVPAHLNFGKYILNNIRRHGDRIALVDSKTGEELTYKALTQYAVDLAYAMCNIGMKKGDVVVLCSEKRNDFIGTMLAVILTGATFTTVIYKSGRVTLRQKLDKTKPKYAICSVSFWEKFKDIISSTESIKTVIGMDDGPDFSVTVKNLMNNTVDVNLFEPAEVEGQSDVAYILYSSGTTGPSKSILLTHKNCILNSKPVEFRDASLKVAWIDGLWYHNYTNFMTAKFLILGRTIIYNSEWKPIDHFLQNVHDYKVNIAFLLPATITYISKLDIDENLNLNSLRLIYSRSAPLQTNIVNKIKNRFTNVEIFQGYGMTEAGEPTSDVWATKGFKPGSVGMASPGTTLKVVDVQTGENLGPNERGEIRIRGPILMKGYIDVNRTSYIDTEGFFMTGDLGYYDEDHYFYVIDRLKDVINYGGYKVCPTEVENILLLHPGVREVAVVGKPDPIMSEMPFAFIVKEANSDVTEKEILDFVVEQADNDKHLTGGVRFIKEIPRNERQKILRTRLREMIFE